MSTARQTLQYELIANHIRSAIQDATLVTGDTLPSESELCEKFNSSRGPVRQAMATLRAEGLISSGREHRSVVLDNRTTESFESVFSATQWLTSCGLEPGARTQWVTRRPAPADLARDLDIAENDPIISICRVRLGNNTPVLIEEQHFHYDVGRFLLEADTDTESIHEVLCRNGVNLDHTSRSLTAIIATNEDAEMLETEPGEPSPVWMNALV